MSTIGDLAPNHVGRVTVTVEVGHTIVKGRLAGLRYNECKPFPALVVASLGEIELPPLVPHHPCLIRGRNE